MHTISVWLLLLQLSADAQLDTQPQAWQSTTSCCCCCYCKLCIECNPCTHSAANEQQKWQHQCQQSTRIHKQPNWVLYSLSVCLSISVSLSLFLSLSLSLSLRCLVSAFKCHKWEFIRPGIVIAALSLLLLLLLSCAVRTAQVANFPGCQADNMAAIWPQSWMLLQNRCASSWTLSINFINRCYRCRCRCRCCCHCDKLEISYR